MNDFTASPLSGINLAGDDKVVPFQVSPLDIRGRSVQLGPMLNAILDRHDYPPAVATLLGEATVLTVLLGTSLKFSGKFIFQVQSDGPVSLLVVDFRTPDAVRAYARFNEEAVAAAVASGQADPQSLLGKGTLAMTVDQGANTQRYQGIVELGGISLQEAAQQYFRQSEQIPTAMRLAVAEIMTPGEAGFQHRWRAGGLIAQFLPEAPERMRTRDLPGGDAPRDQAGEGAAEEREDDAWEEAKALVGTISDDELTDPQIGAERLLFRLFHEHGVHVFEGNPVEDKCSCSREKIVELVRGFEDGELDEAMEDGRIVTTCEFCSTVYTLTQDDLV